MDGRTFLGSARLLMRKPTEANRRSAVSRGYFAILNEARAALERWGFSVAAKAGVDSSVITLFEKAVNRDAIRVGDSLIQLERKREAADYFLTGPGAFADESEAKRLLRLVQIGIDVLDELEADPVRRAAVVAALRAGFP